MQEPNKVADDDLGEVWRPLDVMAWYTIGRGALAPGWTKLTPACPG